MPTPIYRRKVFSVLVTDVFPLPRHSQRPINVIYSSLGTPTGVHTAQASRKALEMSGVR